MLHIAMPPQAHSPEMHGTTGNESAWRVKERQLYRTEWQQICSTTIPASSCAESFMFCVCVCESSVGWWLVAAEFLSMYSISGRRNELMAFGISRSPRSRWIRPRIFDYSGYDPVGEIQVGTCTSYFLSTSLVTLMKRFFYKPFVAVLFISFRFHQFRIELIADWKSQK